MDGGGPVVTLDLTPARLRVLISAAEGHIIRSAWGASQDIHSAIYGCACDLRPSQKVNTQVTWLVHNDLLRRGEAIRSLSWKWTPTDAGMAALGRHPS